MINFSNLKSLKISEGNVIKIKTKDTILWKRPYDVRYVSFGDSIAAGHAITDDWKKSPFNPSLGQYEGTKHQYQQTLSINSTPNPSTILVTDSYTELINRELVSKYGASNVLTTSFARSGDTVADLMNRLLDEPIQSTLSDANVVTLCIGANDILGHVYDKIEHYINTGDLSELEAQVEASLNKLNTDSASASYNSLFKKLSSINSNAKYIFTTIYNPYKFLWIEEGENGFFKPLLQNWIPDLSFSVLGMSFNLKPLIQQYLLQQPIVQQLFDRVNGLDGWTEKYVSLLNNILKAKVKEFQSINPNFMVADTKLLFDSFPDSPVSASKHYSDLVNVEFTRGRDYAAMDWGALWRDEYGNDYGSYWWSFVDKYILNSGTTNPSDWDWGGFAAELVTATIEKVILPNIDPHPEEYGHYLLSRSFMDTLGWKPLDKYSITLKPNGASGADVIKQAVCVDNLPAYITIPVVPYLPIDEGHVFSNWNTFITGEGASYSNAQLIPLNSDLILYAQWTVKRCKLTFHHSRDAIEFGSDQTGPMECYALWIDGTEQADLGAFSNSARVYSLAYGTPVGVIAQVKQGEARSYITWNGTTVAGQSKDARYQFNITKDTDINFEWNQWLSGISLQSYWNCYIAT